jgi:hypothetical protein
LIFIYWYLFSYFSFFIFLPLSQMHLTLNSKQRELTLSDRSGLNQFEERFESTAATRLPAATQQPNCLSEPRGRLPAEDTGRTSRIEASVRYSDFNNDISPADVT